MEKKRILILGGSVNQVPLIQRSKSLGYYVIVGTNRLDVPGINLADEFVFLECTRSREIEQVAKIKNVDGILTNSEALLVPMSEASESIGLPCVPSDIAKLYKDKWKMREFCKVHGFKSPRFKKCLNIYEAIEFFEYIGAKCIIKPLDNSASRGVFSIETVEDIKLHFENSIKCNSSQSSGVLIEEYIQGVEFTVDSFIINGKNHSLAISEKKHYDYNENVAYELLFSYQNDNFDYNELKDVNDLLVESTGLPFGITHAEYKYFKGDFYLIEIQARGGGSYIATDIVPFVSNIDPYNLLIQCTVGEKVNVNFEIVYNDVNRCALLYFFDIPSDGGCVKKISGVDYLNSLGSKIKFEFFFRAGDIIKKAENDSERIGYYILKSKTKKELLEIKQIIEKKVMIEIDVKKKILDYIKCNRVSSTEVADCLGKTGALEGVFPINRGHFKAGFVKWVYANENSNWDVHRMVRDTHADEVVFIEAFNCGKRAIIGELVSKYILLYRQAAAIICNAPFRDAPDLIKENYPIWCTGFTPVGCFNKCPSRPLEPNIEQTHYEKYNGSIAVCDDCGVVIIPKDHLTEEFLKKLIDIEAQEDIWFDRLDHFKEDTFDIVCKKTYLRY